MPRQLPWKVGSDSAAAAKRKVPGQQSALAPVSPSLPATLPATRGKPGTPTVVVGKSRQSLPANSGRSASTSPPPEPLSEEFMIEGFDHDDMFRMVEDEFLAMAGSFTKHLHAAEYQRLKTLASDRNADMILTISRPVTGRMTELVKKRQTALALAASQRKGLKKALGKRKGREPSDTDDDDSDLPWAGTSIQGLMECPRKKAVPLPIVSSITTGTCTTTETSYRAWSASGPGRSPSSGGRGSRNLPPGVATEPDEDEDDLDSQPRFSAKGASLDWTASSILSVNKKTLSMAAMTRREPPSSLHGAKQVTSGADSPRVPTSQYDIRSAKTPPVKSERTHTRDAIPTRVEDSAEEDDEIDFFRRIRDRRTQQEQRRQRERFGTDSDRNESRVDDIPLI